MVTFRLGRFISWQAFFSHLAQSSAWLTLLFWFNAFFVLLLSFAILLFLKMFKTSPNTLYLPIFYLFYSAVCLYTGWTNSNTVLVLLLNILILLYSIFQINSPISQTNKQHLNHSFTDTFQFHTVQIKAGHLEPRRACHTRLLITACSHRRPCTVALLQIRQQTRQASIRKLTHHAVLVSCLCGAQVRSARPLLAKVGSTRSCLFLIRMPLFILL